MDENLKKERKKSERRSSKSQSDIHNNNQYVLGIDVGTTSVKICLVDINSKEVLQKFVKDTLGNMPKDVPQADLQVIRINFGSYLARTGCVNENVASDDVGMRHFH